MEPGNLVRVISAPDRTGTLRRFEFLEKQRGGSSILEIKAKTDSGIESGNT